MCEVVRKETSNKKSGYFLSMLTLTVTSKRYGDKMPNREDIRRFYKETSHFLRLNFGKFKCHETKKGKIVENRKKYIGAGWIATIEVGSDNNNLHCHAIVYGPWQKYFDLLSSWEKITGDSQGVWIKPIQNPQKAANYVLKYITTPPVTDSYKSVANYSVMIKGSRRLRSGGVFYNRIKIPKSEKNCNCLFCRSRLIMSGNIDLVNLNGQIDLYRELREIDDLGLDTYKSILNLPDSQDTSIDCNSLQNQCNLFH